jgi:hypothetical protein
MRRFKDAEGREWEVVAGRESWGRLVAILIPVDGRTAIRQATLLASSYEEADREIEARTDEELRSLLAGSDPKTLE